MAKVTDFTISGEVTDIMKRQIEKTPDIFPGMDVSKIGVTHNNMKTCSKEPLKVISVKYPTSAWVDKTYLIDVAQKTWEEMNERQKNTAVYHTMCYMSAEGSFDETSKNYAAKRKPDIQMFSEELAATGGIPNWMDNEDAKDPLADDVSKTKKAVKVSRTPVTAEVVESA